METRIETGVKQTICLMECKVQTCVNISTYVPNTKAIDQAIPEGVVGTTIQKFTPSPKTSPDTRVSNRLG